MAEEAEGEVRIEVDALATDLENMMSANLSMSSRCCIFRVPNILSRHNPKAYAPNAFSIGPFHYNKPHLKATQKFKLKYLRGLISRFPNSNPQKKLRDLTASIIEIQEEARECYEGSINMSMGKFVKVLVLDGCFLIDLFRKCRYNKLRGKDDPLFSVNCMNTFLYHDLILLENQIPWRVLQLLFDITRTRDDVLPLNLLVTNFFDGTFSREVRIYHEEELRSPYENRHILDLLRNSMVCPSIIAQQKRSFNCSTEWQQIPSATSLKEAGIKFKMATSATVSSIFDVQFKDGNGVLEIPPLIIQDTTESLFRNLICLEQCLPNCEEVITSYAVLLDNLINTSKDMEILCKNGIIENLLDIEDATVFFNQIFNDTNIQHFHYLMLTDEVNKYCRCRWPKYRRVLMRDYFKHPWALISVIVAAILLVLTFLQTLFSIIK